MKLKKLCLICICILAILSLSIASANENITDVNGTSPNIEVPTKIWKDGDYNITVESDEDASLDINGAINYNSTITTGKTSIPIKNLTTGHHNINLNYFTNSTSFQKEYNITVLKENPDWDMDFLGLEGEVTLDTYADHEVSYISVPILNKPEGLTGNFSFYIDGELRRLLDAQENEIYFEGYLEFKDYNFTLVYSGDDYFKPAVKTKIWSIKDVAIDIPSTVVPGYQDKIIVDRYYYTDGTLSIYINGKLYKKEELNEDNYEYINLGYSLSHLKVNETYDIEVIFNGVYNNYTKKATVNVNNRDYVTFKDKDYHIYGEKNYYSFYAPEIDLDITIDGEKAVSTYEYNEHAIDITNLSPGTHTLRVNYKGDETYAKNSFETTFEVIARANYTESVKQNEANSFRLNLPEDFHGNLTIEVKNAQNEYILYKTVELTNSTADIPLPTNHIGKFTFNAYFTGNHEINEIVGIYNVKDHAVWSIEPGWIDDYSDLFIIQYPDVNSLCYVNLTMPNDAIGNLTVEIKKEDGEYRTYETVELEDGKATVTLPTNHVGKYYYRLSFEGNYELKQREDGYTVNSKYYIKDLGNLKYNSKEYISLYLPKDGMGSLTLEVKYNENDTYTVYKTVNLTNGFASIEFPTNLVGNVYYNALYSGNYELYNLTNYTATVVPIFSFENNTFSIVANEELIGIISVIDQLNNIIIKEVNITNGRAEIDITDYLKHLDFYIYANAEIKTSNGEILGSYYEYVEPIFDIDIVSDDVSMYYYDGTEFKATVYRNSEPVSEGEIIEIKIGSETYNKTTDKNGVISLKLIQLPGKYKITATYNGKSVKNTLKVKQVLTIKKVKVKRSAKKLVLTATLKKGKTPLKKQKVTFKFNGKKYKAKTNKKGIAKVTIKKTVLKKLKAGKKLTYTATYKKDTVKKTVKVQK
ncbi:hypothetical protein [Methanobrevibacter sp.]|uniref:hypothetical protein n=1 Tax=Methanobrevibacter sp. TaxID=66852 RepID=UPI00388F57AF